MMDRSASTRRIDSRRDPQSGEIGAGRRAFLGAVAINLLGLAGARTLTAQQPAQTMSGPMNREAYIPISRPERPGAARLLDTEQRDSLEKHLKCLCGCPMDIYTCRTTDFTCPVSPRVHADVEALIAGGYSEAEIRDLFIQTYGERVLTAPEPHGFNLLAYVAPFAAIAIGGVVAAWLISRWRRPVPAVAPATHIPQVSGTAEEMARLEAAVRDDSR